MLDKPKLSAVLRELHSAIGTVFKDNYVLEFLGLPNKKLLQAKLHKLLAELSIGDEEAGKTP